MTKKATPDPATKRKAPMATWVRSVVAWLGQQEGEKVTQEDFAERIGKDRVTVADWMRGASEPSWTSIQAIVKAFPEAPAPPVTVVSDPGSRMPPGLEGFLERYGKRLDPAERSFLENISFRREPGETITMDDAFWWRVVESLGLGDTHS